MVSTKLLTGTILLLLAFAGASFAATCSVDAYKNACASCSFDTSGKIDQSCKDAQKAAGVACVSTSYR